MKTTALHARHLAAGGRMIDFGGWELPVQYRGILEEHRAVRTALGVFDISHMGEIFVSGSRWLNRMLTNNVQKLAVGRGQYTFLLNPEGGMIDDLILYRLAEEEFLLVVNATRCEEDFDWMQSHLEPGVVLENRSATFSALAVQGPMAQAWWEKTFPGKAAPKRMEMLRIGDIWIARSGYTGEDGFELFFENAQAEVLWDKTLRAGAVPCGLGARDTLRLEMGYPLYGNDLDDTHTPLEAGFQKFVDLEKPDFIGKEALLTREQTVRLCGLELAPGAPPPRAHYPLLHEGKPIAELTSGTLSPCLKRGIAMAYLPKTVTSGIELQIRGKNFPITIVPRPFYKP